MGIRVDILIDELGEALREKRESASPKIDQNEVALELECHPSTLSRLERGHHKPDVRLFFAACHWLGRPATDFVRIKSLDKKSGKKSSKKSKVGTNSTITGASEYRTLPDGGMSFIPHRKGDAVSKKNSKKRSSKLLNLLKLR